MFSTKKKLCTIFTTYIKQLLYVCIEWYWMGSNCRMGTILEGKIATANNYEIASSAGAPSGKNMHRQVRKL